MTKFEWLMLALAIICFLLVWPLVRSFLPDMPGLQPIIGFLLGMAIGRLFSEIAHHDQDRWDI